MSLYPKLTNCSECSVLLDLQDKVDCSIANLIANKWNNISYGVGTYFDATQYSNLVKWSNILKKRIINPSFPTTCDSDQLLIGLIYKDLYKISKCPKCQCQ